MGIETEYRGYKITYSENADEWNCYDCKVSHASLSKVKAKIDLLHRKMRQSAAVDCYYVGDDKPIPARLIDFLGGEYSSGRWPETEKKLQGYKVAAMFGRFGADKAARHECRLSQFAPNTVEAEAAIAEWQKADEEVRLAKERLRKAHSAIPRLDLSSIDDLVKASSSRIEEDAE